MVSPEGLKVFGGWPTIYEGLSQLPEQVQKSWFGFDHFYSDKSFSQALEIVFLPLTRNDLLDIGGNTGRWATRCVQYNQGSRSNHCGFASTTGNDEKANGRLAR